MCKKDPCDPCAMPVLTTTFQPDPYIKKPSALISLLYRQMIIDAMLKAK